MKRLLAFGFIGLTAASAYLYVQNSNVEAASAALFSTLSSRDFLASKHPVAVGAKFGFIDNKGRFVIPAKFDDCNQFSQGRAAFKRGSLWGYIDISGHEIIPAKFTKAADFHHGLAKVRDGIYSGYIDKSGKFVLSPRYASGDDFDASGLTEVYYGKKLQLVNAKGETLIDGTCSRIYPAEEGLLTAISGSKYGLLNERGKWVVEPKYDALTECSEGLVAFAKDGKWGYLNKRGKVVIEPKYTQAGIFKNGVAAVRRIDGRCALITAKDVTTYTFPPQCKVILGIPQEDLRKNKEVIEDGLVPVLVKDRWGYVSAYTGKFVIKPKFVDADIFSNGMARVAVPGESSPTSESLDSD